MKWLTCLLLFVACCDCGLHREIGDPAKDACAAVADDDAGVWCACEDGGERDD